jgi:REP element-mobilizing transposase RayT
MEMEQDQHKHLRRLERVWLESPVYFVTVCSQQRQRILADPAVCGVLIDEWRTAHARHGWQVGRYVILPDHVHFFCVAEHNAKTLSEFVRLWKQWTTKRIAAAIANRGSDTSPRLPSAATARVWQREFFDHVLRSQESYAQKWLYVCENPVRAGLVMNANEWPYQGEIHSLEHL